MDSILDGKMREGRIFAAVQGWAFNSRNIADRGSRWPRAGTASGRSNSCAGRLGRARSSPADKTGGRPDGRARRTIPDIREFIVQGQGRRTRPPRCADAVRFDMSNTTAATASNQIQYQNAKTAFA